MTREQAKVYAYLLTHGESDQAAIMDALGKSQRACSRILNLMLERGQVRTRTGLPEDRGGRWEGPADWLWRLESQSRGTRRSRPSRSIMYRERA